MFEGDFAVNWGPINHVKCAQIRGERTPIGLNKNYKQMFMLYSFYKCSCYTVSTWLISPSFCGVCSPAPWWGATEPSLSNYQNMGLHLAQRENENVGSMESSLKTNCWTKTTVNTIHILYCKHSWGSMGPLQKLPNFCDCHYDYSLLVNLIVVIFRLNK